MATSPQIESSSAEIKMLSELRSALLDGIRKCGEVVLQVKDETLKKTILHLEIQTSQYANELNARIEMLGGNKNEINYWDDAPTQLTKKEKNLKKLALGVCKRIEKSVITLYDKVLNQELHNESLKNMIQYQMNGIMCITLQLKLLTKFLHNQ